MHFVSVYCKALHWLYPIPNQNIAEQMETEMLLVLAKTFLLQSSAGSVHLHCNPTLACSGKVYHLSFWISHWETQEISRWEKREIQLVTEDLGVNDISGKSWRKPTLFRLPPHGPLSFRDALQRAKKHVEEGPLH